MKRTLVAVALVVGFAAAASASTLSVVSNKATYSPGEAITLTVSGTDNGAGQVTYPSALGRLNYSSALIPDCFVGGSNVGGCSATSNAIGTGWVATQHPIGGAVSGGAVNGNSTIYAFDELNNPGGRADSLPAGNPFATLVLKAGSTPGVVNITWNASDFVWFGMPVGSATGTSFSIVSIPEPATAGLLGLGLVGLVIGGRRRRS